MKSGTPRVNAGTNVDAESLASLPRRVQELARFGQVSEVADLDDGRNAHLLCRGQHGELEPAGVGVGVADEQRGLGGKCGHGTATRASCPRIESSTDSSPSVSSIPSLIASRTSDTHSSDALRRSPHRVASDTMSPLETLRTLSCPLTRCPILV